MPIECENCQGTDFQVQNGATFCLICGAESQEHGQQTIVDEETLGAFGDHASGLKSKSISRKRRGRKAKSKRDIYKMSYNSLSLFTYILHGWVQDAINELGVDPRLNEIVLALWAQYLSKINMAFSKKPGLPKASRYRDSQVAVTGRKKLIPAHKINRFVKQAKMPAVSKEPQDQEDVNFDEQSSEGRRKRSKAKRQFLDSIASMVSDDDDASSSYLSSSMLTSTEGGESDSESEWTSENEPDVESIHMEVLSRCSDMSGSESIRSRVEVPKLKVIFGLYCLAILLMEDNQLSLVDLIRFAKIGVISFDASAQHIPPVMKIQENFDIARHTGVFSHWFPLDHLHQRRYMANLGALLDLKEVELGNMTSLLKRYLREFSLPKYLSKMLLRSLEATGIFNLSYKFEKYRKDPSFCRPLPSMDLRALALILFGLKYLYGLDDESEYYQRNANTFDVIRWLKLSRKRVFVACKYSTIFHSRFSAEFFPQVKLHPSAIHPYLKQYRLKLSELRNVPGAKHRFYAGDEESSIKLGKALNIPKFEQDFNAASLDNLKGRKSRTPLFEFSRHWLERTHDQDDALDKDELKELLGMHQMKIQLKSVDESNELIEVEPSIVLAKLCLNQEKAPESVMFTNNTQKMGVEGGKNFSPLYWTAAYIGGAIKATDSQVNHTKDANCRLLTLLPDNFAWILRYFSAVADVKPTELYAELIHLETFLVDVKPDYFGQKIRQHDSRDPRYAMPELKYRLTLSC